MYDLVPSPDTRCIYRVSKWRCQDKAHPVLAIAVLRDGWFYIGLLHIQNQVCNISHRRPANKCESAMGAPGRALEVIRHER
jgi:hypothetical protein